MNPSPVTLNEYSRLTTLLNGGQLGVNHTMDPPIVGRHQRHRATGTGCHQGQRVGWGHTLSHAHAHAHGQTNANRIGAVGRRLAQGYQSGRQIVPVHTGLDLAYYLGRNH